MASVTVRSLTVPVTSTEATITNVPPSPAKAIAGGFVMITSRGGGTYLTLISPDEAVVPALLVALTSSMFSPGTRVIVIDPLSAAMAVSSPWIS